MSIAILVENVSAIPRAILALKSIGNTGGDTLKVSPIPAIAIFYCDINNPDFTEQLFDALSDRLLYCIISIYLYNRKDL